MYKFNTTPYSEYIDLFDTLVFRIIIIMEQNKWNGNNYNSIYEESVSFLDGILEQLFINQYL